MKLGSGFFSFLTGVFDFQTWSHEFETTVHTEVPLEQGSVDLHTCEENHLSEVPVEFNPTVVIMAGEIFQVGVKFFLRIDIANLLSLLPPIRARLHIHSFRSDFLNESLCSFGKHGALIHSSNEVDFFAFESFSEMDHGSFEAILTVTHSLIYT